MAIAWRINSLDVGLAFNLGKLTVDDLLDGLQQGAVGLTNSAFSGAQDALSSANQWLIDTASEHWPAAAGPLEAWRRGSESFMDEAGRQPRWLQELLYTGKLPAPAEVLGQGLYLGLHAGGDVFGSTFFNDGSPYVPTHRETSPSRRRRRWPIWSPTWSGPTTRATPTTPPTVRPSRSPWSRATRPASSSTSPAPPSR
ncbi:hypothetical protein G7085_12520 [Tessaracoccus sp. HDW20]|uniref:hypothetical protein n=1 Tax=Tessaracoccus coleopterorum TaxID=2714950 RepID=UPI0018D3CDFE|nr:hypothetical protein [Tessaracoccus coleopterorum]NHB85169.1 hypothetical protein [Tessaracoccus coleopterorum]